MITTEEYNLHDSHMRIADDHGGFPSQKASNAESISMS